MRDRLETERKQFILVVADEITDALVHPQPTPVQADQTHADRVELERRFELALGLSKKPVRLRAVRHILCDAHCSENLIPSRSGSI